MEGPSNFLRPSADMASRAIDDSVSKPAPSNNSIAPVTIGHNGKDTAMT